MKYSYRPEYLQIADKGKCWAALYILIDLAYYLSLLSGIMGASVWLTLPLFQFAKGEGQHWYFYVSGFVITVTVTFTIFQISIWAYKWLLRYLNIKQL